MNEPNRDLLTRLREQSHALAAQAIADEKSARDRIVRAAIAEVHARSDNLFAAIMGDRDRERQRQRWERIKAATDELRNAVGDYQEEFGE